MDWDKYFPSMLTWGSSAVTGLFTLLGAWFASRSSLKQLAVKLRHESDKDRNEARRIRLEELYSLIDRWAGQVVTHHITYRKVMNGELTYNQALDITIKQGASNTIDSHRMFMLAELYFSSAHEALQELKELRDNAATIQNSFREAYKLGMTTTQDYPEILTRILENFNAAIQKYKAALAQYTQEL